MAACPDSIDVASQRRRASRSSRGGRWSSAIAIAPHAARAASSPPAWPPIPSKTAATPFSGVAQHAVLVYVRVPCRAQRGCVPARRGVIGGDELLLDLEFSRRTHGVDGGVPPRARHPCALWRMNPPRMFLSSARFRPHNVHVGRRTRSLEPIPEPGDADERTRTSTSRRTQAPEACASTNSATSACAG